MKKNFPIIIVLISLSLIGIIYIQVNWILTMEDNKREELHQKLLFAMNDVGQDLIEHTGAPSHDLKNLRLKRGFPWKPSYQFLMELQKPTTIAEKFSEDEISDKIRKAFINRGLKDTKFEFCISSERGISTDLSSNTPEIRSANFLKNFEDTVHYIPYVYVLALPSGSDLEGLVPAESLCVVVPDIKSIAFKQIRFMIVGVVFFTLIIISAFYVTVSTLLRQKKLSEIKNDFINNMTHELKTPLATISLAIDALRNEKVVKDRQKSDYFNGIIKEENKRMNKQVETILQAALLEKQELQLNLQPIHVHTIIRDVVDSFQLQLEERKGKADLQLNAKNDLVEADEVHFTNLIANLVDNAMKYSKDQIVIKITTHGTNKNLVVRIEDNGIGMNKETQRRIFERFYRAHTGNIHNVKGFGLGLSYVRTIVDAHHGKIKVESVIGKGTIFTLEFPLKKQLSIAAEQ
ncbi:MAG TPA: HAMP domain-containing sensor histidine kinase [Puia sp.]|nr:HAMP domain-containing sensor histidine kinase [Puia sp.]